MHGACVMTEKDTPGDVEKLINELIKSQNDSFQLLFKSVEDNIGRQTRINVVSVVTAGSVILGIISVLAAFAWFIICMKIENQFLNTRYAEAVIVDQKIASSSDALRHQIERQLDILMAVDSQFKRRRTSSYRIRQHAY